MSIGLRFISNNLIGKTAAVTFTPASGGTLQNLGIKTILFNNVTSYTYGSYNINVLEYNYIYNFNVFSWLCFYKGRNQLISVFLLYNY